MSAEEGNEFVRNSLKKIDDDPQNYVPFVIGRMSYGELYIRYLHSISIVVD